MFQVSHFYTTFSEHTKWFDKDQVTSFVHEYRQSPDKTQFISDKEKQYVAIRQVCWIFSLSFVFMIGFDSTQRNAKLGTNRRHQSAKLTSKSVGRSVGRNVKEGLPNFLEELGYQHEIAYYGHYGILRHCSSDFRTPKPHTDKG